MCFNTQIERRASGLQLLLMYLCKAIFARRFLITLHFCGVTERHFAYTFLKCFFLGVWQFFSMTGCHGRFFSPSVQRGRISEAPVFVVVWWMFCILHILLQICCAYLQVSWNIFLILIVDECLQSINGHLIDRLIASWLWTVSKTPWCCLTVTNYLRVFYIRPLFFLPPALSALLLLL